jgi:hypothetical protein
MTTALWLYEYPIWINHCNDTKLFGILPQELVKYIINMVITNIVIKRSKVINLPIIRSNIVRIFDNNTENFHFQPNILYDINIVKLILINISKIKNKPIIISHICCDGKGISFQYTNSKKKSNKRFVSKIL